ncbi:Aorsin [Grifola frondosa]|uniref:tripeptidyl-peptidase II n=1 Tax=Grifola frondosa TaxID=5627 RepID=A0A1C7M6U1_GRIFR|nr:Aorsin [Grifola frondosa]
MLLTTRVLLALALEFTLAFALPSGSEHSPRIVHESRRSLPEGWTPVRRAEPLTTLPFRVALVQSNLESIEDYLLEVSHPDSPSYGNHWSAAKVAETFRPSAESVDVVRAWLVDSGIDAQRVKLSASGGWLHANVTVEEAERILDTKYYIYEHSEHDLEHIACDNTYHLPERVSKHVELITPTLHFDLKVKRGPAMKRSAAKNVGQPGFGPVSPKTTGKIQTIFNELEHCNEQITPICLRALYNFVYTPFAASKNSIGIVEYTPQAYLPSDLDIFFTNFSKSQIGQRPTLVSIDGGTIDVPYEGFGYNGESDLDLQYAMSLVGKEQNVTLYQAGDDVVGASFNNFLDALDGSYCTFEGGNDPNWDAPYPDPYNGGYEGPNQCGGITPAHVISTSYSYNEYELTPFYMQRQCAEYAKLGLMGVTVLYSSGDYGVAGYSGVCLDADGNPSSSGSSFAPSFPGTCPYITSVGATQVNPGAKVTDPESACEQKSAVDTYLSNYPPSYPTGTYNTSGSRAYPDLSANGANYVVAIDGGYELVYGTSASSPVTAAILSAVNDARLAIGRKPIGFINPAIYTAAFKHAFNDITNGTNPGCGTVGFPAQPGWDPVTGVGTPNFPLLLAAFLLLP